MKLGEYGSRSGSRVTDWALRVSVALAFFVAGTDKFSAGWIQPFEIIGLGQWFRYFTGCVEILGGLLFLVPPLTTVGAVMLISTMIGAMITQAFILHHPMDALFPGIYLAGASVAYVKLRSDRRRAAPGSRHSSS
jgi:putative oxidoreductase